MAWDFSTDAAFAERLRWVDAFVRDEVEPLDFVVDNPRDVYDPIRQELIPPLQKVVREHGLWSAHLPASLGGAGLGHVDQCLLNEILGRSHCAPMVFAAACASRRRTRAVSAADITVLPMLPVERLKQ